MKVVVLGAGVVGVTTAYYLARAGAEVTVIDRNAGPALDTSFANAGQISYGYSTPWGPRAFRPRPSSGCLNSTRRWPFASMAARFN